MAINIAIYVFKDVEVLDFAGPFEVFTTANRVFQRISGAKAPFNVFTVAEKDEVVTARAGLSVLADKNINAHPRIDVLIVPGGVITEELKKSNVIGWIRRISVTSQLTASICTGAFLLAKASLLDGKTVTTHWEDIADLEASFPRLSVNKGVRWIDEGRIITSAGISAGIDMSLHLVSRLVDDDLAAGTARQLEFDWTKNPSQPTGQ